MHYLIKRLAISLLFFNIIDASIFQKARTFPTYPGIKEENDLLSACKNGDIEKVKWHITNKTRLDCQEPDGATPLMLAARGQNMVIVQLLLDTKADSTLQDHVGCTFKDWGLYHAVQSKNWKQAHYWQTLGASNAALIYTKEIAITLLELACRDNNTENVTELLKLGANPNIFKYESPLFWAAKHNNDKIIELLLKHKANINARHPKCGSPVLVCTASFDNQTIFRILLEKKADITMINNRGEVVFMHAVGRKKIMQLFKEFNLHPRGQAIAQRIQEAMPEMLKNLVSCISSYIDYQYDIFDAIEQGDPQGVQQQILENPDLTLKNEEGFTPLSWTYANRTWLREKDFNDIIFILYQCIDKSDVQEFTEFGKLDKDAINYQDENGNTALILAAKENRTKNFKILITLGANQTLKNKDGKSAQDYVTVPPAPKAKTNSKKSSGLFSRFFGKS